MSSPEPLKLLEKRIRTALATIPFRLLPPFEGEVVARTIAWIGADDRLRALIDRLDDDESLRGTLLSLYFRTQCATP